MLNTTIYVQNSFYKKRVCSCARKSTVPANRSSPQLHSPGRTTAQRSQEAERHGIKRERRKKIKRERVNARQSAWSASQWITKEAFCCVDVSVADTQESRLTGYQRLSSKMTIILERFSSFTLIFETGESFARTILKLHECYKGNNFFLTSKPPIWGK